MHYTEVNKKAYDVLSKEYLERMKNKTGFEEPLDNLVGIPLNLAKTRFEVVNVLEIGPGSGEICKFLADGGCETTAIDISERVLRVVSQVSPSTKRVLGNVLEYTIPVGGYQLVFCGALIHLFKVEDAKKILSNIHQGLVKNGILFMNTTIHEKSDEGFYVKKDYEVKIERFRHRYTEKEFKDLIEKSGFRIVDRIFTDQNDRGKKWVAFVAERV